MNMKAKRLLGSLEKEGIQIQTTKESERVALSTFIAISKLEPLSGIPQFSPSISRSIDHHLECSLGTDVLFKILHTN